MLLALVRLHLREPHGGVTALRHDAVVVRLLGGVGAPVGGAAEHPGELREAGGGDILLALVVPPVHLQHNTTLQHGQLNATAWRLHAAGFWMHSKFCFTRSTNAHRCLSQRDTLRI